MPETSAKKTHKKRKTRTKMKKRKPKVTKEFQEMEKEIAGILDSTELSIDNIEEDPDELGIAFFCNINQLENSPKIEPTTSLAEESEQSETPRTQTASSFIQVEDDEPIKRVPAVKVAFDENLLFTPSSSMNPYIQNVHIGDPVLKPNSNLIRLVNRYHEEGSHHHITSGSSLENQTNFFQDDLLYATVCEREFNPIFCVIKPGDTSSSIIPSRKLMTLNIKELKFTEHPQQQDEHTLVRKLEDLLDAHFSRKEKKIEQNIKSDLEHLRKHVNNLLEDGTTNDIIDLEENLSKLKLLRTSLHHEETISKDLLRDILDTWIQLKKLRKRQEFHWTTLKLKIKLNEVDTDQDSAVWTKRFETELNEIYREELEAYYRAKRLFNIDSTKKSTKPKKPSIENIKKNLKQILKQCSRVPGEPEIEIIRTNLSDSSRPLDKIKTYYMRVLFDGQLVGSTKSFRLEPDLSIVVNESLGIYLDRRIPKEIQIKLYEKKKLPSVPVKIANILVPLPTVSNGYQYTEIINFSSHKQRNISGRLNIVFHCDEGVYSKEILQNIFPPPTPRTQIPDNILQNWQRNQLIDSSSKTQLTDSPKTVQTSEDEDEDEGNDQQDTCTFQESLLEFCSREEIDNNQRFRLLTSIYRREMKSRDIRFVPYLEYELEEECEDKVIEIGNWMDPIDVHKHNGKKYLRNLYEVVKNHCEQLTQITGHSEGLLIGNSIVTLKAFFASLATMFGPSRPLNPKRTAQSVTISYENIQKFNIVVNVVRATGIPVRAFTAPTFQRRESSTTSMFSSQTFKYSNVRPYVSVAYMDRTIRTLTADGSSPTWNEQLILQISSNPVELKGDLKIAIFDECVENHVSDERSMEVLQRFQSNWLGEYRLPISTILARQRIEGVFELNSPKVLIGYHPPSLNEALPVENIPEIRERVNVWLYVSVEPSFEMPQVTTNNLECSELKEVKHHIQEWCIEAKEIQPTRYIDPLVCTMDGKRVCLTRLLEPVPLPIDTSENLLDSACRYVSLLNVLKHSDPCMNFRGIWLNNETILDTGWGSPKDLGILLANFLLTIGIRCWVVLGISYPHGESAYVLYQDEGNFVMLDPSIGKKYASKDAYCPMNKVFYILSQDNIFCNIQSENRVSMMNFDTEDSSCWFPMFNKKNPAPLGGVQKLNYAYRNSHNIAELRKNIERKIMKKISAWRPMQKTIWNRAFQSKLLKVLVDLEYESTFTSLPSTINHTEGIFSEFGNYKLFGFTLNFSYINLSSISERIKSTGIHLNGDKKVEFSVAVHIHSYPYDVLSVWIFLVTAIPL